MLKKILQTILLSAILIGLPLGSYYYLKSGLEFRKEKLSEMTEHGNFPAFQFENKEGDKVDSDVFLDQKLVLFAIPGMDGANDSLPGKFERVFEPYNDNDEIVAFYLRAGASSKSVDMELKGSDGFYDLDAFNYPELTQFFRSLAIENGMSMKDIYALADGEGMVRNIYVPGDQKSETMLVEHVAVLLPTLKSKDNGRR